MIIDPEIAALLTQRFGIPLDDEDARSSTLDDFGFDSLSALELTLIANEDLDIAVSDNEITPRMTLAHLLTVLTTSRRSTLPREGGTVKGTM
ncbi:acyl carrier protein [Streptomyces lavendulae]|uniref:acyl carrier protein n=1 Tax=Streptomyces lavendulae TaxID=1914 RepID=UPI0037FD6A98